MAPKSSKPAYGDWKKAFRKAVQRDGIAKQAIRTLADHGCEVTALERLLFAISKRRPWLPVATWGKNGRRDLIRSARRLRSSIARALYETRKLQDSRVSPFLDMSALDIYYKIRPRLLQRYQEIAEEGLDRCELFATTSTLMKPLGSQISNEALLNLWAYINVRTGRCCYKEMAELIVVSDFAIGRPGRLDVLALSRRIQRLRRAKKEKAQQILRDSRVEHSPRTNTRHP